MGNLLRRKLSDCSRLRDALEESAKVSESLPALGEHLNTCAECQIVADEFYMSRALLEALPSQRYEPSNWFVTRVISAITVREAELKRSLDTWTIVPRLAAKLTWVSALALLLAGTWLYESPKSAPPRQTDTAGEALFDSPSSPAVQDDLLASFVETEQ